MSDVGPDDWDASLDDIELELRLLPGVRAAGFVPHDDVLLVHVDVVGEDRPPTMEAVRVAARGASRPVAVEVGHVRPLPRTDGPLPATTPPATAAPSPEAPPATAAPSPEAPPAPPGARPAGADAEPRARLLSVLSFPDTDEVEVHLLLGSRRTIGRGRAGDGVEGVVAATLDAVTDLATPFSTTVRWVRVLEPDGEPESGALVAVALVVDHGVEGRLGCYGLAASHGPMDAAARATLDALNRQLTRAAS